MPSIRVLSEDLIGKIAAGEVVERPASVIKELVENSVDASSKEISVHIEDGGKAKIIIIDDGCGMDESDARTCILRHATSKISTDEDLNKIHTLGFRGEAIPSIAAVSKLSIETKTADNVVKPGFKIILHGGQVMESGEFGCPTGTKISVEDLFFNTPARKKFLKSSKTEEGHIVDTVSKLALTFPNIRFKLFADGKEKLACLSANDPKARLREVFGASLANDTISFEDNGAGIKIFGFLGDPKLAGRYSQGVYLFVNNRFIRDRVINHAVVDGYRSLLPGGCSPFGIIFLEIDPTRVDVNVHPTKQEVRFDNSGAIHSFVANAVRKALQRKTDRSPPFKEGVGEEINYTALPRVPQFTESHRNFLYAPVQQPAYAQLQEKIKFGEHKVIGQLADSYILCEGVDRELVVIDQHAVHERIGFEKLKAQLAKNTIEAQHLLLPEQIELQSKEAAYIEEYKETLSRLGIEIENFGGKTFIIKSVPALFAGTDIKSMIFALAHELSEIGNSSNTEEKIEHILKTIACHKQVRAGDKLSFEEMNALLKEMDEWPNTDQCPHGRPSFVEYEPDEIAKWFKRT